MTDMASDCYVCEHEIEFHENGGECRVNGCGCAIYEPPERPDENFEV